MQREASLIKVEIILLYYCVISQEDYCIREKGTGWGWERAGANEASFTGSVLSEGLSKGWWQVEEVTRSDFAVVHVHRWCQSCQ